MDAAAMANRNGRRRLSGYFNHWSLRQRPDGTSGTESKVQRRRFGGWSGSLHL
jgi:hypothetical protein